MSEIEVKLETMRQTTFAGIAQHGRIGELSIGDIWGKMGEMTEERFQDRDTYGIQIYHPRFPEVFEITYLAAVEVRPSEVMPERLLQKVLPESKYAIFKSPKGLDTIREAWRYSGHWLTESEYRRKFPYDIEVYRRSEGKAHCQSDIYVYVPIVEKS